MSNEQRERQNARIERPKTQKSSHRKICNIGKKKPILAFLATGQHGAAELRVGPDGRLSGRAAVTKTAA
eukprot:scaffold26846_cov140-Isochrysis_galbana.AAC.2